MSSKQTFPRRSPVRPRAAAAVAVCSAQLVAATVNAAAAEWIAQPPLPEANGGFVCGAVAGQLVVAGGTNWKDDTKRWLDRVWTLDSAGGQWRDGGRLEGPLAYAAVAGDGRNLWFAGGSSGLHTYRALWRFDKALAPQLVNRLDRGAVYAGAALIDSTLYVVGGSDDQARFEHASNRFYAIDVRNGRTRRLEDLPERGFAVGAVAACAGQIFVFGGAHATDSTNVVNHASAHAYSTRSERWGKLAPLSSPRRGLAAVTLDDHRIFLAGGYKNEEEGFTSETFIYDTRRDEYFPATPLPYAAMVGLVKLGDDVFCIGGEDRKKHRTGAVFKIAVRELIAGAAKR